jgi:hypothetical protein
MATQLAQHRDSLQARLGVGFLTDEHPETKLKP